MYQYFTITVWVQFNGLIPSLSEEWADYPPSNLVDGFFTNFAHTPDKKSGAAGYWIRVQLPDGARLIERIKIYNRIDGWHDRIVGMSVYIKDGTDNVVKKCTTIEKKLEVYDIPCEGRGDTVEISKVGITLQQNIAEIQVFGTGESKARIFNFYNFA